MKLNSNSNVQIDNSNNKNSKEKNYYLTAAEVLGINAFVLLKARYFENENWAKISLKSIKNNFKKGFVWDDNTFGMNQFLHPYHGSAYFSAARSNGLSFWESAPFSFGGSLIWEMCMEVELPSYNDLINTTLSGIILGEISYRIGNQIIDESSVGFERITRELTSLLINPVQGFNRLIQGRMWNTLHNHTKTILDIRLLLGLNYLFVDRKISDSYAYFFVGFDMDYGNKLLTSKHKKPFDYINIDSEFSFANGDNIIGISASGVLWDWKYRTINKFIAGFYKEFDYFENNVYKFTATSLTYEMTTKTNLSSLSCIQSSIGVSGIFLGGTNSIYSKDVSMNYNLGPGIGVRIFINGELSDNVTLSFKYKQFWIYIVNGLSGNEFIGLFDMELNYKIFYNNSIGLSMVLYDRHGIYSDFPDEHLSNASAKIFTRIYL